MDGAAASKSKSICGWTWRSALNIIPPWSTVFLHIYLVTAVTDWEERVYPAAVGIALLTRDFQLYTTRASRNVCNQFIMMKFEWLVHDPSLGFLVFQPYKCLVHKSKAPFLGNYQLWEAVGLRGQYLSVSDAENELQGEQHEQRRSMCGCYWWQSCFPGVLGRWMQIRST